MEEPTPLARATRTERLADLLVHLIGHGACRGYVIADITVTDGRLRSITCLVCGSTSFHGDDIRQRYCGYCHAFHDDVLAGRT